jgi:hypothetical protein
MAPKKAVGGGVFFFHQKIRTINKIIERVHFFHHFAVFIPFVAHFHAAPDVGNGNDEAAIHETDFVAIE